MKVEIYSDVACPWCYIGKRRFERALAAFPGADQVEVVYRPYQLNPDAPAAAFPLQQYLAQRFGAQGAQMARQVTQTARAEGIAMNFDSALAANTLDAHRLLRLAEREFGAGVQQALKEKLLEAHFGQGADVGDAGVLETLAADAGMDGARVRGYLAGDEGRREVKDEIAQAQRLGITAVPTFVIDGRYAVQGAQPASAFLQVLEQVAGEAKESDASAGGGRCDEGSCAA
ncbi:DsbA family oxidoreductase [Longimicrobium sp.]|jgi:predicted DsbA family dithiol-disulfide isomerase|uniref:DsbA family oxidoreductase n=1 Tax=Longimicrobium sp. TaxID=2029185 RepID=UPI002F954677